MHAIGIALFALAPQTVHLDIAPADPPESLFYTERLRTPQIMGDVDGDGVEDFFMQLDRLSEDKANGDPGLKILSGATFEILTSIDYDSEAGYRTRAVPVGDLDGDGVGDILSGHPGHPHSQGNDDATKDGRASLWSGRTGLLIRNHDGEGEEGLGFAITGIEDLDGDGVGDYAVGSPRLADDRGIVRVYSGADGSLMHSIVGPLDSWYGVRLCAPGDLNGDGSPDLLISDYSIKGVVAYSPSSGAVFREHVPQDLDSGWLNDPSAFDDLDGDGVPEYMLSARNEDVVGPGGVILEYAGVVRVYNGATGEVAYFVSGGATDFMGSGHVTGDANGDGYRDFVVTRLGPPQEAQLRSGTTGEILRIWTAEAWDSTVWCEVLPDLDGDGAQDPVVGHWTLIPGNDALLHGYCDYYRSLYHNVPHEVLTPRFGQRSGEALTLAYINQDQVVDLVVGTPHEDLEGLDHGVVRAYSGVGAVETWRVDGAVGAQLGAAVATIGDVDQDGVRDIAIGAPREHSPGIFVSKRTGWVHVVSGATGAELYGMWSTDSGERFGAMLAAVGDVDGDGVDDFVAGSPDYQPYGQTKPYGRATLRSGATGTTLATYTGTSLGSRLGHSGAGPGDVNGDGVPDVALGLPGRAAVQLRSGADGTMLWIHGNTAYARLGWSLAAVGDLDGDGIGDLAAGSPGPVDNVPDDGHVVLISGVDGSSIAVVRGAPGERFGAAVAPAGDVDLDGVPDIAVGAPDSYQSVVGPILGNKAGRVVIVSGAHPGLAPLREWAGDTPFARFGSVLAGGTGLDFDYDEIADLVASSPRQDDDEGRVLALSARAQDTNPFGVGTPGCDGGHRLLTSTSPVLGETTYLRADAASPLAVGFRFVSLGADVFGTDWGFGFLFHVDVTHLFAIAGATVDAAGVAEFPMPIPDDASLAGVELHMQVVFAGPAGACPELPGPYSSTPGLRLVLGE